MLFIINIIIPIAIIILIGSIMSIILSSDKKQKTSDYDLDPYSDLEWEPYCEQYVKDAERGNRTPERIHYLISSAPIDICQDAIEECFARNLDYLIMPALKERFNLEN